MMAMVFSNGKTELTLAIIKPDGMSYYLEIREKIISNGFKVLLEDYRLLKKDELALFYSEHKEKPFYEELISFMSSAYVCILVLEREDAVVKWREVIGKTNPNEAAPGTIRNLYGNRQDITKNVVHGSDCLASAEREICIFFPQFIKILRKRGYFGE